MRKSDETFIAWSLREAEKTCDHARNNLRRGDLRDYQFKKFEDHPSKSTYVGERNTPNQSLLNSEIIKQRAYFHGESFSGSVIDRMIFGRDSFERL